MTATPPPGNYPPPGDYPPPGNYPPPSEYPSSSGYPPPAALPADAYTPWLTRVFAALIDYAPYAAVLGIGYAIEAGTQETACVTDTSGLNLGDICATGNSEMGVAAIYLSVLVGFLFVVWNYGYKQGTTGSSIGKSIMKFKVVSETTGQPIGFGMSLLRQLAHGIDAVICYIGFLFPLWDAKRQTLADKILTTICVPTT